MIQRVRRVDLKAKRTQDMMVVRELWVKSNKEQPALKQDARLDLVLREASMKAPSGNFFYLSSFKTVAPSLRWVKMALEGVTDRGSKGTRIGPALIPTGNGVGRGNYPRKKAAKKLTMKKRLDRLEKAVKALGGTLD